jgi:hypothetical protein
MGSKVSLKVFYTIWGIILPKSLDDNYKHGFVFAYINQTLKLASIIKSRPRT